MTIGFELVRSDAFYVYSVGILQIILHVQAAYG